MDILHTSNSIGARLLQANMDPGVLRPYIAEDGKPYVSLMVNGKLTAVPIGNATLRKDEWKVYDDAIVRAARDRLVFVNYLVGKGLVYNVEGMAKTVLETENLNDMTAAELTMDGINRGDKDRAIFELVGVPLPIAHKEFTISTRVLNASRTTGQALDTTQGEQSSRKVSEKIEEIHLNGASNYSAGGYVLRGITDFPQRNTGSMGTAWDASAATGDTILTDVLAMKQDLLDVNFYGPYCLLVPGNYETKLDEDFKANGDKTIRQRLSEVGGLSDIIVVDRLSDSNVIMFQITTDVIRVVNGLAITTLQWEEVGGLELNFKVMSIQVPQVRADQTGKCGIVHYT